MLLAPLLHLCLLGGAAAHSRRSSKEHQRRAVSARSPLALDEATHTHAKRFTGTGTFYDTTGTGDPACGGQGDNNAYVVALNSAQFGGGYPGPNCFKSLSITAEGVTVSGITVIDECPTCNYGDLDLSPALFNRFAPSVKGVISITWNFDDGSSQESTTTEKPKPEPTPTTSEETTSAEPTTSETPTSSSTSTMTSTSSSTVISSSASLNATSTALNATVSASASVSRNATASISASAAATSAKTDGIAVVVGQGQEDQGVLGNANSFVVRLGYLITLAATGGA